MSALNKQDELRQINSDLAWWREAFPRVLGFTFRIEATILTTGGGTMEVSGVFRDDIVAQLAAARESALREAADAIDPAIFDHPSVFMGGPSRQAKRSAEMVQKIIRVLINNPGKEVMPDEASSARGSSDTAPAGLSAGGGAGWRDVLAERQRQISEEGWTPEHDDQWTDGQLAGAAAAYASASSFYDVDPYQAVLSIWPWNHEWLKLTTPRRDLVKAGALILAEIERLDRAAPPATEGSAPPAWPDGLIHLTGDIAGRHCAIEGCERRVSTRFEGRDYCEPCGRSLAEGKCW